MIHHRTLLFSILVAFVLLGCSGPEGQTPDDTDATEVTLEDVFEEVRDQDEPDVMEDGDVEEDILASQECEFPPPRLGDDPRVRALADSPARCGQPDYAWLESESLGDVTAYGHETRFQTSVLRALLQAQNIVLPRDLTYDVRLRQYAYLTQDRGELIEATSFVAHPANSDDDSPRDVLLLLHGTMGFADHCAPSDQFEAQGLAAVLASLGYVVVAPDYLGMKALGDPTGFLHPYLVGEATAMASLDAVRAWGKFPDEEKQGMCITPRVVTFGGSQGGHAALWVDRLGPYYAAELDYLGAVATVPPADLVGQTMRALTVPVKATDNTLAFWGTAGSWYGVSNLDDYLISPLNEEIPETLATDCSPKRYSRDVEGVDEIFEAAVLDAVAAGSLLAPWDCITAENALTATTVERINVDSESYGILFILGDEDDLVHTPIEREAFDTLCAQSSPIPLQYLECAGGRHGPTTVLALPEILDFIDDRLEGRPMDEALLCDRGEAVTCRGESP